jgi:2-acylglycerol O-acyltransferase 2
MASFWRNWCDYFPSRWSKLTTWNLKESACSVTIHMGSSALAQLEELQEKGRTLDLSEKNTTELTAGGSGSLFPGIGRRLVSLPVNFGMPFLHELDLLIGLVNSDKRTFRNVLRKCESAVVVVGGAREAEWRQWWKKDR